MTIKQKYILQLLIWEWRFWRSRRLSKKVDKWDGEERYPDQWKIRYVTNKAKKFVKLLNVDLEVKGWDSLPKAPYILAPNHSSGFDAAALIVALEKKDKIQNEPYILPLFLSKSELNNKKNRFYGYMNILNTFYIDREKPKAALQTMEECVKHGKDKKKAIIIFPEGTRTIDGNIGEFKAGAFREAKKQFLPIVPVTINNSWAATDMSRKGRLKVEIIFGTPIKPMKFIQLENKDIAAMVEKEVKRNWKFPEVVRTLKENEV